MIVVTEGAGIIFEGKLIYSVYNAGTIDVILRYGGPIFILFMTYIREGARPYSGEHKNQQHIKTKDMMPLMGAGIPIHNLEQRLKTVETTITIYGGLLIALVILLIKYGLK